MADLLTYPAVREFLSMLVPPREVEMQAMEKYAEKTNFPIIGPTAGYMCYQVARMISAKSVLEMGLRYGYSTAWFAKAVKENGGESCITSSGTRSFLKWRPAICPGLDTGI